MAPLSERSLLTTNMNAHRVVPPSSKEHICSSSSVASSMSGRTRAAKGKRDKEIRSRLLNRLGIYNPCPGVGPAEEPVCSPALCRRIRILRGMGMGGIRQIGPLPHMADSSSAVRPPLGGVVPFTEPLKGTPPEPQAPSSWLGISSSSPKKSKKTEARRPPKIAFDDTVVVLPIPMRNEYSDRIKSRIWSNRFEIHENAQRNTVEFAAEGWNWRSVTEDEGMFVCSVSGELVHPVHCQQFYQEQQQAVPELPGAPGVSLAKSVKVGC